MVPALAKWQDVQDKAVRLRNADSVTVSKLTDDEIEGEVKGDHGTYHCVIYRRSHGSWKVSDWECECLWNDYAFGRSPKYRKFEARVCSHILALLMEAHSREYRKDSPDYKDTKQPRKRKTPKAADKEPKTRIVYHGTAGIMRGSILLHGLRPRPDRPHSYVTTDYDRARYYAKAWAAWHDDHALMNGQPMRHEGVVAGWRLRNDELEPDDYNPDGEPDQFKVKGGIGAHRVLKHFETIKFPELENEGERMQWQAIHAGIWHWAKKAGVNRNDTWTVYHGTNSWKLRRALEKGQFEQEHGPRETAHSIEEHYGLPKNSVYNHGDFSFATSYRGRENGDFLHTSDSKDTARSYAVLNGEMLNDALHAAHAIMHPHHYTGNTVERIEKQHEADACDKQFRAAFHQAQGIEPVTVTLRVPRKFMEENSNIFESRSNMWGSTGEFTWDRHLDLRQQFPGEPILNEIKIQHPVPTSFITHTEHGPQGKYKNYWKEANNMSFLNDPHDELYPPLFEGKMDVSAKAREKLQDYILGVLADWPDARSWINFTLYGSGISYNWDESGDLDVQVWVDPDRYFAAHPEEPREPDELLLKLRKALIQSGRNYPTTSAIGLSGEMRVQYYIKLGTGSDDEVLAQKPYAAYDLDQGYWQVPPEKFGPEFYADAFDAVYDKTYDIADQAESALSAYRRDVADAEFWITMAERDPDNRAYQRRAEHAKTEAEQTKDGVKHLFDQVFQGRMEAYGPEGQGIKDPRDATQKLLEAWGLFDDLEQVAREDLPWSTSQASSLPS